MVSIQVAISLVQLSALVSNDKLMKKMSLFLKAFDFFMSRLGM